MSTVFLSRNRKSLYHRVWIPEALRLFFKGRSEVWRSLRTMDKEEARCRAYQLESHAKRVFVTLKRHGHSLTPEQIESLVARWLYTRLEAAEDFRASLRPDERKNKPATVSKWLAVLSGVFRWAERQDFIPENSKPVKGFQLTKKQAREGAEHYREFTVEELMLTFGSEEFRAQKDKHPERPVCHIGFYPVITLSSLVFCRHDSLTTTSLSMM